LQAGHFGVLLGSRCSRSCHGFLQVVAAVLRFCAALAAPSSWLSAMPARGEIRPIVDAPASGEVAPSPDVRRAFASVRLRGRPPDRSGSDPVERDVFG
jgi:hypothetical protein